MKTTPAYPLDIHRTVFNNAYIHITADNDTKTKQGNNLNPKSKSTKGAQIRYHIINITGNPGCIGYYNEFLSDLWGELEDTRADGTNISIYGTSLSGFVGRAASATGTPGVLDLNGQIEYLESCIRGYIERYVIDRVEVEHRLILMGHSVGGYIGLELIRRHQAQCRDGNSRGFQIIGYVGLWPTVTHIVDSIRGRRFGWLLKLPLFAFLVSMLAKILMFVVGKSIVAAVLRLVGFPEQAAEVTVDFLASPDGVYQALYLAGHEMRQITVDRWDEDIWGAETPSAAYPRPKLVLCFGQDDHWVANHHRDQLIKKRGPGSVKDDWRPIMVIDDTGIPHSFCISHSGVVARMTANWIQDMIPSDR